MPEKSIEGNRETSEGNQGQKPSQEHEEKKTGLDGQVYATDKNQIEYENSDSLYRSGLILSSVKNPPMGYEESSNGRLGSQTTLDSNYDIDDVANELIRLSEEQQSYDAQL